MQRGDTAVDTGPIAVLSDLGVHDECEIELSADHREGQVELPATSDGNYRFVLEAEHGIRTELEPRRLSVKIDQPPKFTQVLGAAENKEINPYDQLSIDIALSDDVGVESLAVEYRVNKGPPASEPIALDGQGKQQARARHRFSLALGPVGTIRFHASPGLRDVLIALVPTRRAS